MCRGTLFLQSGICMNIHKYLSVMLFTSTLWGTTVVGSSAQSHEMHFPLVNFAHAQWHKIKTIAQNPETDSPSSTRDQDLTVKNIAITRNSSDKSLLNIKGQIQNQSGQTHYVYYIVAKFVSRSASIEQAIIPVNTTIEPGQSTVFTHEISTERLNSTNPESVKPIVVKYEYR